MNETSKVTSITGGAVGLSALALVFGTCCIAPWAVALLGVGGAVMLARLAFVQPYLVAATAVLIAVGFWYVYRRTPTDGSCSVANRRRLRWLVWTGALIVIAIDIASFVPLFLG